MQGVLCWSWDPSRGQLVHDLGDLSGCSVVRQLGRCLGVNMEGVLRARDFGDASVDGIIVEK